MHSCLDSDCLARQFLILLFLFLPVGSWAQEDRGALVTSLEGKVALVSGGEKRQLAAFDRLEANDHLVLESARVTLVFFLTGRQETYRGSGRIDLGPGEGKPTGLPVAETKILAPFLVRQIGRTPTLLAQGRAGVTRLRSIATPDAIAKVDEAYRRMHLEAAADDLSPEMYRLSALFDMKAYDAVRSAVKDLEMSRPGHTEAKLLASLYRKALKNAQ